MHRYTHFLTSAFIALLGIHLALPVSASDAPDITASLSNFDIHNRSTSGYDRFTLSLDGDLAPDCIGAYYSGWGTPPKVEAGTEFRRAGMTLVWEGRRAPIAPGRSEHFGVRLDCDARAAARGFWSIAGRPAREVPMPWQSWEARGGRVWDVIGFPRVIDLGPVAVQREFVALPKAIELQDLTWQKTDEIVRKLGLVWTHADRDAKRLAPGEQLVLNIPVNASDRAAVVRYTVSERGSIVARFVNEAILAWEPTCYPDLPAPELEVIGTEDYTGSDGNPYTRYHIAVTNSAAFPDALFSPAPDLPPCGTNPDSSRTWVDINDGDGNRLYGFCALGSAESLGKLWFARARGEPPPACASVTLEDRRCTQTYASNCASTEGFGPDCINLDDPPLGTTYAVGSSFVDAGTTLSVVPFQWSGGGWTSDGFARVSNAGTAGHLGQELIVNNVNIRFNFPTLPNAVALNFGEYGGNVNLEVNGDFRNFEDFAAIDGQIIGGAQVSVVNGFGHDQGTLRLNGDIHALAVGGQELVIDHICITEAPGVDASGVWILPYGVGGTRLDGIQPDGLTDYTDHASGFDMEDAPFGGHLGFRLGAANVLPTAEITYYRFLYKQDSTTEWIDFDEPVAVHYQKESAALPPVFPKLMLGPVHFAGKNLYLFRPHEEDLPDLVSVAPGETLSWPATGFMGDIYSGFLSTAAKHLPAGRYQIKVEIYSAAGAQVMPGPTSFRFIKPIGETPDGTILTDHADAATEIDAGGFVFTLHIDNRPARAVIDQATIGAVGAGDCGFLEYNPAVPELLAPVNVALHATHPEGRAVFTFRIYRGPHEVPLAKVEGAEVSALTTGTMGIFGDAYSADGSGSFARRFARSELLNCCGLHCIEAAFSENLHVFAKATTGWHWRINSLDAHAVRAFALTPR